MVGAGLLPRVVDRVRELGDDPRCTRRHLVVLLWGCINLDAAAVPAWFVRHIADLFCLRDGVPDLEDAAILLWSLSYTQTHHVEAQHRVTAAVFLSPADVPCGADHLANLLWGLVRLGWDSPAMVALVCERLKPVLTSVPAAGFERLHWALGASIASL